MKVRIIEKDKNFLKLEIEGEGHTLFNFVQTLLLQEKGVEIAGYNKPHPLKENTILHLRTKEGTSPEEALMTAIEKGKTEVNGFQSTFEKEMAKQESNRRRTQ